MAKQQTPIQPVQWTPRNGGLLSDADPKNIRDGDLYVTGVNTGAMNMRTSGRGNNVSPDYEPMYGNEYVYELDDVVVQNKTFRLYLDVTNADPTSDFTFNLYSASNNLLYTYTDTFDSSDISLALSDVDGFITAELSGYTPTTSTTVTGSYTGYIDIEFTYAPNFNYVFEFEIDAGDTVASVEVTQEAIDPSMIGEWNLIGSDDKTGNDFQFWTTRVTLPIEDEILNITNPSGTIVQVETVLAHGLVENQAIRISDVVGLPETIGKWTAINVTTYTFELANCVWVGSAYVSGGIVSTYIYGLGEIGVATKDDNSVTSYTKLLRSNEFGFSTLHQIDCRVKRKQDSKYACYFTESRGTESIESDTTNVPRVFYYKGAFETDGALNSDNIYEYGTIASEIAWILSNSDFRLEWSSQTQSGGAVKSGNWRYAARLLTSDFTATQFCQMTSEVPVFKYDYTSAPLVIGDVANVNTSKINVLKLTNNTQDIFKYVEIAAINYLGNNGFQGYLIGRFLLNGETIQYIEHNGNESGLIDLDPSELNNVLPAFIKAQNVELLDNRAVLSNLTPSQVTDFTEWVETFKYSLDRWSLDPVGTWTDDFSELQAGEYQIPENVYSKKSHMMFETYRYGFRMRLKNGTLTQVFYPGYDITIDLPTALPPERIAGTFTSFDLTDGVSSLASEVYSVYITWLNVNLSYLIDGVPVYELIDEIIPCRATVIPEVLMHGASLLGVSGMESIVLFYGPGDGTISANHPIGPFPYAFGGSANGSIPYPANPTYTEGTQGSGVVAFDPERASIFFYCPDLSWRLTGVTYQSGDQIINLGNPYRNKVETITAANTNLPAYYAEYNGNTSITTNPTPITINPNGSLFMEFNGGLQPINSDSGVAPNIPGNTVIAGNSYNTVFVINSGLTPPIKYTPFITDICVVCDLPSNLTNTGTATDYGFYRTVYFRPQPGKYGDAINTVYTEFLEPFIVDTNRGYIASGDFVTQGDCFTQKTYLKHRYPGWFDREGSAVADVNDGWGTGVAYYSQNRNNIQLRSKPNDAYLSSNVILQFPKTAWLIFGYADPANPVGVGNNLYYPNYRDSQLFYNRGYTPKNLIASERAFNENLDFQIDWGNAIAWSNPEVEGSNTDNLRVFPPFNLKFLDYTQGAITDARAVNGELITIQPREVQRQYFNSTNAITTTDGSEVVLGDASVLGRRGTTMNKYGSSHKWSVLLGLSDRGHDVLYAIDDFNKTVWRIGYDGTTTIDELSGMKTFFANNISWIKGKYTPADDEGVRGVVNQRYKEVLWTVRGRKQYEEWAESDTYTDIFTFESLKGDELITNPTFSGSLYGYESLDGAYTPDPTIWQWNSGTGGYAYIAPGDSGFLTQDGGIAWNSAKYLIEVRVLSLGSGTIDISFQNGGPVEFSISAAGTYYFVYKDVLGDDNIYLYHTSAAGPGQISASIEYVSVKEILSGVDWSGEPTWTFGANEACADGSDGDELVQTIPDYVVAGVSNILDYTIDGTTTGDVTAWIADQVDTTRIADGSYQAVLTPTVTGVIKFVPANNFDGCVKGNLRLTYSVTRRYVLGDIVQVPGDNFNDLPDLYECIVDTAGGSLPNALNPDWQLIPHTDPRYYNEYTIVFSERKNKFQAFMSILPKIYSQFYDGYLVPRPVSNTGAMYISDEGLPTTWFAQDASILSEDAYFDAMINNPQGRKRFLATRVESQIAPYQMIVTTPSGEATTSNAEFIQREDNEFDGVVKDDDTGSGSIMWGDWAIFRFVTRTGTYNKFNSFIAKVRERARTWYN